MGADKSAIESQQTEVANQANQADLEVDPQISLLQESAMPGRGNVNREELGLLSFAAHRQAPAQDRNALLESQVRGIAESQLDFGRQVCMEVGLADPDSLMILDQSAMNTRIRTALLAKGLPAEECLTLSREARIPDLALAV